WTSCQLFISDIMCTRCRPTAWNSFVCEHLNDINEKLSKGSCWKLTEFIATHQETLQHDFAQLTDAHKSNYVTQLMQESVQKQAVIHDQPKAAQHKMSTAFETMHKEVCFIVSLINCIAHLTQWSSLCSSLGMEGFYIAVCGGVEDLSAPKVFFSPKGNKFVHSVLDLEPHHLALKLESFVISGLGMSPSQLSDLLNKSHIQHSLGDILHDNSVTRSVCMNYDNYECKIVEHFGMELIGWPNNLLPICNPGQLGGCDRVQKLLVALTTKVCHWKKLSDEERQRRIILNTECHAHGEQIYKPCKKHTSLGTEKSAAIIASDVNDNGIGNGGECDKGSSVA
ncbi:hypothetical protein EDC04DRAFT_2582096, partial [Pisolithus marmoratus]